LDLQHLARVFYIQFLFFLVACTSDRDRCMQRDDRIACAVACRQTGDYVCLKAAYLSTDHAEKRELLSIGCANGAGDKQTCDALAAADAGVFYGP
jgi:hypothetical protein